MKSKKRSSLKCSPNFYPKSGEEQKKNLTRKPELFQAPLGPGTMYPLNPPLVGPVCNYRLHKPKYLLNSYREIELLNDSSGVCQLWLRSLRLKCFWISGNVGPRTLLYRRIRALKSEKCNKTWVLVQVYGFWCIFLFFLIKSATIGCPKGCVAKIATNYQYWIGWLMFLL